jgi:hypothetical protein
MARTRDADTDILPPDLTARDYTRDFHSYARLLKRIAPGVPLFGPAAANPSRHLSWISMLVSRATHAEGIFPFVRILSNVIVRELQTMAIVLDVWLGVPVIYSTYMQYDELAHHFGPSSTGALSDLKRTDARIAEIWRMIQEGAPRRYDLVILSDHGMTPAKSYRVLFKESLGTTVTRLMSKGPDSSTVPEPGNADVLTSASEDSEYADVGPGIVESVAQMSRHRHKSWRRAPADLRKSA